MSLYQEIPKTSIESVLKRKFTDNEITLVKAEIAELLYTCTNYNELYDRTAELINLKSKGFREANQRYSHS